MSLSSRIITSLLSKKIHATSREFNRGAHRLNGIFLPLTAPFDKACQSKQDIAYDKLEKNFITWNQWNLSGYVVHGSSGEFVHLSTCEKVVLVKHVKKIMDPKKLLIVGVGCESTLATLQAAEDMAKVGGDIAMVVTPSYYRQHLSERHLLEYYKEIAQCCPLPVLLYNVPAFTGVDMSAELVISLASNPKIIGIKDSSGDVGKLTHIASQTLNMDFQILAGSANFIFPAYKIGCVGAICALTNVLGAELCRFHQLYEDCKMKEALDLQYRFIGPNVAITKKYGVAGLKCAMDWRGLYGGHPRRPLLPLLEGEIECLKEAFEKNGFGPVGSEWGCK